jgi:hypothetical protein
MNIKDKITEKEGNVRQQLEKLRSNLNNKRLEFNKTPNDWSYFAALSHTELKLNEILEYFEPNSK